jgi:hypothetical protein
MELKIYRDLRIHLSRQWYAFHPRHATELHRLIAGGGFQGLLHGD